MTPIRYSQVQDFRPFEFDTRGGKTYRGKFTESRIDRASLPKRKFAYDIRHGDDMSTFCTVEESVTVNYAGTLITNDKLPLRKGILHIQEWGFTE